MNIKIENNLVVKGTQQCECDSAVKKYKYKISYKRNTYHMATRVAVLCT